MTVSQHLQAISGQLADEKAHAGGIKTTCLGTPLDEDLIEFYSTDIYPDKAASILPGLDKGKIDYQCDLLFSYDSGKVI